VETSIVIPEFVDARVGPRGSLENLSQAEIAKLLDSSQGGLYDLFRKCALAVLNSGADTDNAKEIFDRYRDFNIEIVRHAWGIKLQIRDGFDGYLVDSVEECAQRTIDLLADPVGADALGAQGREHVRDNFLSTRELQDWLTLFGTLRK